MKYTIPCLFGLEALVADELRRLDLKTSGPKTAGSTATAARRTSPG